MCIAQYKLFQTDTLQVHQKRTCTGAAQTLLDRHPSGAAQTRTYQCHTGSCRQTLSRGSTKARVKVQHRLVQLSYADITGAGQATDTSRCRTSCCRPMGSGRRQMLVNGLGPRPLIQLSRGQFLASLVNIRKVNAPRLYIINIFF